MVRCCKIFWPKRFAAGYKQTTSTRGFMADGKLSGKTAVITGGSKGLGKAMAQSLGRAGAKLALVARNATELSATAKELSASGIAAEPFPAALTKEADVRRIAPAVVQPFGKVQILTHNAGINIRKSVTE